MSTNNSTAYKIPEETYNVREYLKVISDNEQEVELKLDTNALDTGSKIDLISKHFEEIMVKLFLILKKLIMMICHSPIWLIEIKIKETLLLIKL